VVRSKTRRPVVRVVLFACAILYATGTILGGIGLGWIALHPPSPPVTASEESHAASYAREESLQFRDADLSAADGSTLHAWFMLPKEWNGDAVILLHGVSDNRLGMYGYGQWLAANRYAVLLPDARHHGNSTGLATYGLKEADDIHQWVNWNETNQHPRCMFGLGESMGAAQLLQSLSREPRFCAVVAESPFASFREVAYTRFGREFHTGPWLGRTFFHPTVNLGFLYVRLRYGLNMEAAAPEQSVRATKTPILLIHGLNDRNIPPYHSDLIEAENPDAIVVWKVPGAFHTGAHYAAPQQFEAKVLQWFSSHSR